MLLKPQRKKMTLTDSSLNEWGKAFSKVLLFLGFIEIIPQLFWSLPDWDAKHGVEMSFGFVNSCAAVAHWLQLLKVHLSSTTSQTEQANPWPHQPAHTHHEPH